MNSFGQNASPHKRILFLMSLPDMPEFHQYDTEIEQCHQKLEELGVTVRGDISKETMKDMCCFDVVVVLAHLEEDTNELLLANSRLGIADFLECIPNGFSGFLDFSSCHSSLWNNSIKGKCPDCTVSGAVGQTTLPFRLFIYPYVMQLFLTEEDMSYDKAYVTVQDFVIEEMGQADSMEGLDDQNGDDASSLATKCGDKMSSIFAPSKVVKGKAFMVQVMLYDESESLRRVTIKAKKIDPETRHVETQTLPIKLKKGDKIAIRFDAVSVPAEHISVDNAIKEIKWNGDSGKIQFNVTVLEGFLSDSFIGKLLMEVNHEPVGESSFRIQVAEKENLAPSSVGMKARDTHTEGEASRAELKRHLQEHLADLYGQLADDAVGTNHNDILKAIETCKLCINLIDNPIEEENPPRPRKVFISSTCESFMQPFRDVVRQVVSSLKMEPEMCDNWPQSGCNPTNMCCQKVLDSDIYLGLFGGRYGYIEPSLDSSMTQVEYLTAVSAKKKILLFVLNPLNETDEPEPIKERQKAFVESMQASRILRKFNNVNQLSELTKNDLLDFIART